MAPKEKKKKTKEENELTYKAHKHESLFMIAFQCLSHFCPVTWANAQALMLTWGTTETKQKESV